MQEKAEWSTTLEGWRYAHYFKLVLRKGKLCPIVNWKLPNNVSQAVLWRNAKVM